MEEQWLNLYIDSNFELKYIDLVGKTKLVILPHSGNRKFIYYQ